MHCQLKLKVGFHSILPLSRLLKICDMILIRSCNIMFPGIMHLWLLLLFAKVIILRSIDFSEED